MDSCRICRRRRAEGSEFCPYHEAAYANLRKAFDRWKDALGISWEDFLGKVSENPETGEWAREVAQELVRGVDR